jgi:hypothetical protein
VKLDDELAKGLPELEVTFDKFAMLRISGNRQ